jgi:hypothetical protein
MSTQRTTRALTAHGTRLLLDGHPFLWQGVSFFSAIYNPTFNRSAGDRLAWLSTLKANGVNAIRVWCQWDFLPPPSGIPDPDFSPFHRQVFDYLRHHPTW